MSAACLDRERQPLSSRQRGQDYKSSGGGEEDRDALGKIGMELEK